MYRYLKWLFCLVFTVPLASCVVTYSGTNPKKYESVKKTEKQPKNYYYLRLSEGDSFSKVKRDVKDWLSVYYKEYFEYSNSTEKRWKFGYKSYSAKRKNDRNFAEALWRVLCLKPVGDSTIEIEYADFDKLGSELKRRDDSEIPHDLIRFIRGHMVSPRLPPYSREELYLSQKRKREGVIVEASDLRNQLADTTVREERMTKYLGPSSGRAIHTTHIIYDTDGREMEGYLENAPAYRHFFFYTKDGQRKYTVVRSGAHAFGIVVDLFDDRGEAFSTQYYLCGDAFRGNQNRSVVQSKLDSLIVLGRLRESVIHE